MNIIYAHKIYFSRFYNGLNMEGWWQYFVNINIESINEVCKNSSLRWTNHVLVRLLQRGITTDDVVYALQNGEIIEQYPTDYPYPSCLVLGVSLDNQYLHVVCGMGDMELWLITAYYPDSDKWLSDFKTRKEKE